MGGLGDEHALLAKARAAGPPPTDTLDRVYRLNNVKTEDETHFGSWRDAAKSVELAIHSAYPKIHEFERSVLPSIRTLRAQFRCGLCKYCQRPMIESLLPQHLVDCERRLKLQRQVKHQFSSEQEQSVEPDSAKVESASVAPTKRKRKTAEDGASRKNWRPSAHEDDDEEAPPAKRAKSTKVKAAKAVKQAKAAKPAKPTKIAKQPKQPKEKPTAVYNPDKNCGVLLPSAQPCMRSLTCKQHSMGAKRAVSGRSTSYDVLLGNYHRQHQVKQAQMSASAAQAAQIESDQLQEAQAQQNPEREVHQVLEGVSRVFCAPLSKGQISYSSSRNANFRLREMLAVALLPRRLPPTGDVLYGRSLAFRPESPDQLTYVRSQPVQQALYISQLQQRQMQLRRQAEARMLQNPSAVNGGARSMMSSGTQTQQPASGSPLDSLQQQRQQQQVSARLSAQQQLQHRLSQSQNRNSN